MKRCKKFERTHSKQKSDGGKFDYRKINLTNVFVDISRYFWLSIATLTLAEVYFCIKKAQREQRCTARLAMYHTAVLLWSARDIASMAL